MATLWDLDFLLTIFFLESLEPREVFRNKHVKKLSALRTQPSHIIVSICRITSCVYFQDNREKQAQTLNLV